jgi:type VI secretion system protein VasJ
MDLLNLGKEPVSEGTPAGSDVRYEPEFEELQAEIDKLSNPSASGEMDWNKVNKLSAGILSSKSKDLLVASYFAVAQIQTNKAQGLGVGLTVYRDLLQEFWEDLFPKKKRMRGRLAAMEWWLEKSEAAMETLNPEPLPAETVDAFRKSIQEINELLHKYTDDAPLLRPLERCLDRIPIKAAEKTEPEPPPTSEEKPEAPKTPQKEPEKQKAPPAVEPVEIDSTSDPDSMMKSVLQNVHKVANHVFFKNADLSHAQAYRWRRMAGWSMIENLPASTDRRTQIPPPPNYNDVYSRLNQLRSDSNWEALLQTAEEKFQSAVLWLDLNRFVSEALDGLGEAYQKARDTVCQETGYFVYRLPGLEKLSYADETPFGDAETQQWLKEIAFGGGGIVAESVPAGGTEKDHLLSETIQKAQGLAKKKKVGEAVAILQQALRGSYSRQEQLLWRLGLAQILLNAKKTQLALPHLETVIQDIDTYKLEEWDPNLALKGLKMVWRGLRTQTDDDGKAQATRVLNRIAKLDPAEALLMGKQ